MRFLGTVRLENHSVLSGEEGFIRGLFELATGRNITSVAYTFDRNPSDQSRTVQVQVQILYKSYYR